MFKLKKVKQEKSKLKVKKRKVKYYWEIEKERKKREREIKWTSYIKVSFPIKAVKYTGNVFSGSGSGGIKKNGFARMVTVKKDNRRHTAHLLRLCTERQLAPRPDLIISSEDYSYEESIERIKNLHNPSGRKQRNAYLEIYCAFENLDLLRNYIKELSQKFNTEVFGIIHNDESVTHCHILISWNNKQGKAIRLKRSDLNNLWALTIQRLQPSRKVPKRGEGLPSVPYWKYRKAWLEGEEAYRKLCYENWNRWKAFYEWLEENGEIEPPYRRKFFMEWYEDRKDIEDEENRNPFLFVDKIVMKLKDKKEEKQNEEKLIDEEILIAAHQLEMNEDRGDLIDAQQLEMNEDRGELLIEDKVEENLSEIEKEIDRMIDEIIEEKRKEEIELRKGNKIEELEQKEGREEEIRKVEVETVTIDNFEGNRDKIENVVEGNLIEEKMDRLKEIEKQLFSSFDKVKGKGKFLKFGKVF